MKFRNSDVPLSIGNNGCDRANYNPYKRSWYLSFTAERWAARKAALAARRQALRGANRRFRRSNGLSLCYS